MTQVSGNFYKYFFVLVSCNRVCLRILSVNVLFKSNKESKIDWQICPVGV